MRVVTTHDVQRASDAYDLSYSGANAKTVVRHIRAYGCNRPYSNMGKLTKSFPESVTDFLRYELCVTGIQVFLSDEVGAFLLKFSRTSKEFLGVLSVWASMSHKILGFDYVCRLNYLRDIDPVRKPTNHGEYKMPRRDYDTDNCEDENSANAERNEMVTLLQVAKGAKIVKVVYGTNKDNAGGQKTYVYKYVGDEELSIDDIVLLQTANSYSIGVVVDVTNEAPSSLDYNYRNPIRFVIGKIDADLSARLRQLDRDYVKLITQSDAQDKVDRITRMLGVTLEDLSLMPPSAGTVEDKTDEGRP